MYSKEDQLGKGKSSKKKQAKSKAKYPIQQEPLVSKITTVTQHIVNDLGVDSEADLFLIMYKKGTKKSFLSGKKIYSPESRMSSMFYGQFAHVLAKGKNQYPNFKLYSKNIILLTNHEHMLLDQGSEAQREAYAKEHGCDWGKIEELKEELKEEYKILNGG